MRKHCAAKAKLIAAFCFPLLGCVSQAVTARDEASAHCGLLHPPEPAGCQDTGGGIFGSDPEGSELAFSYHQCGSRSEVWLDRFVRREGKSAVWQVEDVLTLPQLRKLESVFDSDCTYRPDKKTQVIAIGTWVDQGGGGFVKPVRHAWTLDAKSRRFKSVPGSTVSCEVTENRD
jgi:hypothetical protein